MLTDIGDDGPHGEGEDELRQKDHAAHDCNVRPDAPHLVCPALLVVPFLWGQKTRGLASFNFSALYTMPSRHGTRTVTGGSKGENFYRFGAGSFYFTGKKFTAAET